MIKETHNQNTHFGSYPVLNNYCFLFFFSHLAFLPRSALGVHEKILSSQTWHRVSCACGDCIGSSRTTTAKVYMSTMDETSAAIADTNDTPIVEAIEPVVVESSSDGDASTTTTPVEEAKVVESDVPSEVLAMDGVQSQDEAHNVTRPARKYLTKKPKGLPLSDFKVGDTIKAKARTVAAYGAFMDIGAETDGLLHISNLSTEFVSSVNDVIEVGKDYDVRIMSIDMAKKQIALTFLTEEQETEAASNMSSRPPKQQQQQQQQQRSKGGDNNSGGNRRDDAAATTTRQGMG
jgi:predicted RNA-binding protein with RPS1 domain